MPVPRLIGRLGGPPEVVETAIAAISTGSHSVTLPTGWGSGWCVFQGATSQRISGVELFGSETRTDSTNEYLRSGTAIGGVLLQAGQSTSIGRRLEGTLTQIRMS